jgi:hypothetical protein
MHAVTVRLQDTVYSSARQLAEREGLSLFPENRDGFRWKAAPDRDPGRRSHGGARSYEGPAREGAALPAPVVT